MSEQSWGHGAGTVPGTQGSAGGTAGGHAAGCCGSPASLLSLLLTSPSPSWPYGHLLTKPGGHGVAGGPWLPTCPMHYCRGCSKRAAFAPWQWYTSTFPSGTECGGPRAEGRFAAEPGRDAPAAPWPKRGAQGRGHGHAAHNMVLGVVPRVAHAPDQAAAVLLPQAVEACSEDEGPEPEARQQVRGRGAPSAEPLGRAGLSGPAGLCRQNGSRCKWIWTEQIEGPGCAGHAGQTPPRWDLPVHAGVPHLP